MHVFINIQAVYTIKVSSFYVYKLYACIHVYKFAYLWII